MEGPPAQNSLPVLCLKSFTQLISIPKSAAIRNLASIPFENFGIDLTRPMSRSPLTSAIITGSDRSLTETFNLLATYSFASPIFMPRVICIRPTRSPAVRTPPMPEAIVWVIAIPRGSPNPTYNPSRRQISTIALEALETASAGGYSATGVPPTPMPTFA